MKRPSFQFYPADWRKDTALQFCSISARGLWVEMMCIAHECEPYGHLVVNGRPMTPAQIGRLVGVAEKECNKLLGELFEAGVPSKTTEGVIFSRRMVSDEEVRNKRAEGGKAGSEHGGKGALHGSKGGRPAKQKTPQETPLSGSERGVIEPPKEPPPSSSSSSSSSNHSEANASGGEPPKPLTADEIIFGYGLPLLTNAGTADKQARSFLGGLRKQHGDTALIDKLRECIKAKPLQPLEWLAAALPPSGSVVPMRNKPAPENFATKDYGTGGRL